MQGKHHCRDMNLILIQPHLYFFFLQMYIKIPNYETVGIKKMNPLFKSAAFGLQKWHFRRAKRPLSERKSGTFEK